MPARRTDAGELTLGDRVRAEVARLRGGEREPVLTSEQIDALDAIVAAELAKAG